MRKRIVSMMCVFLFIINMTNALAVESRASNYFSFTEVYASAQSSGEILVEITINATHTMTQVGVKRIYIYEQQSDGDYEIVHTFKYEDDTSMMRTNNAFYFGSFTYQGTSGVKYYATTSLYAKDSSGSETMYVNSNIV